MSITLAAPAKLTRSLHIVGVRADGYHLLDAEMVSLDWGDVVTVDPGGAGLSVDGPFARGVPLDGTNLAAKALALAGRQAAINITKRIPHGAGLGGGSADAAAVLRWAGVEDVQAAARLGADVPFCVRGGRARVQGIGEVITPLVDIDLAVTLVVPPLSVSTPQVYRAWDALGGPTGHVNDLEPAALVVEPALARWRDRIAEVLGRPPVLAGSGATWFVEEDRGDLAAALPDALVVTTRTGRQHGGADGRSGSGASPRQES